MLFILLIFIYTIQIKDIIMAETLSNNKILYMDNSGKLATSQIDESKLIELDKISELEDKLSNIIDLIKIDLLNMIYPIGSIYISVNNVSPATYLGGEWESFGQGKTLVGVDSLDTDFNTVGKTGGEKKHLLTVQEMPSHGHMIGIRHGDGTYTSGEVLNCGLVWNPGDGRIRHSTTTTGGNQTHNNLQPYITVYMWKRVK